MADTDPFDFTPTATPQETAEVLDAATRMRQAAARLRELDTAASPAPWQHDGPWWHDPDGDGPAAPTGCVTAGTERVAVLLGVPWAGDTDRSEANLALAAVLRNVAAPLAVWLDDSASEAEQIGPNRFALALANALLGPTVGPGTEPQPSS